MVNTCTSPNAGKNVIFFLEPVLGQQDLNRLADHFLGRVAKQRLGGCIPACDDSVQCFSNDGIVRRFNQCFIAAVLRFEFLAPADVAQKCKELAATGFGVRHGDFHGPDTTILCAVQTFKKVVALANGRANMLLRLTGVLSCLQFRDCHVQEFIAGVARQRGICLIGLRNPARGIHNKKAVGRRFYRDLVLSTFLSQFGLCAPAIRNVLEKRIDGHNFATGIVLDGSRADIQPDLGFQLRIENTHDNIGNGRTRCKRPHCRMVLTRKGGTVFVDCMPSGIGGGGASHLIKRKSQNTFGRRIALGDMTFGIMNDDTQGHGVKHGLTECSLRRRIPTFGPMHEAPGPSEFTTKVRKSDWCS